eukprot:TRINITY_DN10730_c0_g1_i3.p1 TRINITY_DN10730_c0_g1~~TRINITY_DN10730_c0_g1_i3.p1  ORF type:complete len:668 (+),score=102.00 TRINITY_DN10730_c0_g1_i3:71-2005(+)
MARSPPAATRPCAQRRPRRRRTSCAVAVARAIGLACSYGFGAAGRGVAAAAGVAEPARARRWPGPETVDCAAQVVGEADASFWALFRAALQTRQLPNIKPFALKVYEQVHEQIYDGRHFQEAWLEKLSEELAMGLLLALEGGTGAGVEAPSIPAAAAGWVPPCAAGILLAIEARYFVGLDEEALYLAGARREPGQEVMSYGALRDIALLVAFSVLNAPDWSLDFLESSAWNVSSWLVITRLTMRKYYATYEEYEADNPVRPPPLSPHWTALVPPLRVEGGARRLARPGVSVALFATHPAFALNTVRQLELAANQAGICAAEAVDVVLFGTTHWHMEGDALAAEIDRRIFPDWSGWRKAGKQRVTEFRRELLELAKALRPLAQRAGARARCPLQRRPVGGAQRRELRGGGDGGRLGRHPRAGHGPRLGARWREQAYHRATGVPDWLQRALCAAGLALPAPPRRTRCARRGRAAAHPGLADAVGLRPSVHGLPMQPQASGRAGAGSLRRAPARGAPHGAPGLWRDRQVSGRRLVAVGAVHVRCARHLGFGADPSPASRAHDSQDGVEPRLRERRLLLRLRRRVRERAARGAAGSAAGRRGARGDCCEAAQLASPRRRRRRRRRAVGGLGGARAGRRGVALCAHAPR